MSRKDKIAHPITEAFRLSFGAVGHSKDGKKAVVKERDVKWVPATKSAIKPAKKRRKAG